MKPTRLLALLSGVVLVLIVTTAMTQTKSNIQGLAWLAGCWEGRQGDSLLEEHW